MTCICTLLLFTRYYTQSKVVHQYGGESVVTSRGKRSIFKSRIVWETDLKTRNGFYNTDTHFNTRFTAYLRWMNKIFLPYLRPNYQVSSWPYGVVHVMAVRRPDFESPPPPRGGYFLLLFFYFQTGYYEIDVPFCVRQNSLCLIKKNIYRTVSV